VCYHLHAAPMEKIMISLRQIGFEEREVPDD
jgi:hypothetical protein